MQRLSTNLCAGVAALGLVTVASVATTDAAIACPPPPAPVRDLDLPRFYADPEGATVDAARARQHQVAVAPLVSFLRTIVDAADVAARGRDPARTACALSWLTKWAEGGAWLGRMATPQAEYQRKWDLAGIALAYVKLRPAATSDQRRVIEPWLLQWSARARAFFDDPQRRRNNHWYWLGLARMATALATDTPAEWQAARDVFDDALSDIGTDGVLPLELERRERALFYHVFAMVPLVLMAEIAARRGEDWYARSDGALHRLVALSAAGLATPATFAARAGAPQELPVNPRAGWLSLYRTRFPDRLAGLSLPLVPDKNRWLGGDVRLLMSALERNR